ncbi:MAG: RDD family protein [Actinomycetota bacterium]|nr:RDD family protein [Actinomycetota bacterium]
MTHSPPAPGVAPAPAQGVARADGPSGPRAGFWRRFAASLLDGILIGVASVILGALLRGAGSALATLLSIAYYVYFEGGPTGQTLGKQALGIRVVDLPAGGEIGYGRAFIRWLGRILSSIPILLGYFWMLWDREKQTWHDKLSTAVVVPVEAYPVASPTRTV